MAVFSTGSSSAKYALASCATRMSGSRVRRSSDVPAVIQAIVATCVFKPAFGSSTTMASPYWFGLPPVGSPTKVAVVSLLELDDELHRR